MTWFDAAKKRQADLMLGRWHGRFSDAVATKIATDDAPRAYALLERAEEILVDYGHCTTPEEMYEAHSNAMVLRRDLEGKEETDAQDEKV